MQIQLFMHFSLRCTKIVFRYVPLNYVTQFDELWSISVPHKTNR